MTVVRPLTLLIVTLALVLATPLASAGVGDYSCTNPSRVYFGNSCLFQRPAEVDADQVYDRISEYQEIVRRGLTAKSPQYHLLMKKATKRFAEAVKKMARSHNHDLVAQTGAVKKARKAAKDVPDRTQDVIQKLD